ncbi:MAG TPA: hypothetical protein VE981_07255 [Planctomycetota bacterium]|nr:hypothetical protein [Planctomycetota bacterium]
MAIARRSRVGLPPLRWLVLVGVSRVIVAIGIGGLRSSQRASNERHASTMLKTLASAEADFRANDRDWNLVNDFWTGDVSGLYYEKAANTRNEIRLIEELQADSDPKALLTLPSGSGPLKGYRYQALDRDEAFKGDEALCKKDTDKSGRKVHPMNKYGFCAFPEKSSAGKFMFKLNENNTIFREDPSKPRDRFPNDDELKSYWSKID